jgi:hypothetical protein
VGSKAEKPYQTEFVVESLHLNQLSDYKQFKSHVEKSTNIITKPVSSSSE